MVKGVCRLVLSCLCWWYLQDCLPAQLLTKLSSPSCRGPAVAVPRCPRQQHKNVQIFQNKKNVIIFSVDFSVCDGVGWGVCVPWQPLVQPGAVTAPGQVRPNTAPVSSARDTRASRPSTATTTQLQELRATFEKVCRGIQRTRSSDTLHGPRSCLELPGNFILAVIQWRSVKREELQEIGSLSPSQDWQFSLHFKGPDQICQLKSRPGKNFPINLTQLTLLGVIFIKGLWSPSELPVAKHAKCSPT